MRITMVRQKDKDSTEKDDGEIKAWDRQRRVTMFRVSRTAREPFTLAIDITMSPDAAPFDATVDWDLLLNPDGDHVINSNFDGTSEQDSYYTPVSDVGQIAHT